MSHQPYMPKGKIEILHEYREMPESEDSTMKHCIVEANAKGLLVLTDSTLLGPHISPPVNEAGRLSSDAHRIESVEVFEISPAELIGLIRQHGTKMTLAQKQSNVHKPNGHAR